MTSSDAFLIIQQFQFLDTRFEISIHHDQDGEECLYVCALYSMPSIWAPGKIIELNLTCRIYHKDLDEEQLKRDLTNRLFHLWIHEFTEHLRYNGKHVYTPHPDNRVDHLSDVSLILDRYQSHLQLLIHAQKLRNIEDGNP